MFEKLLKDKTDNTLIQLFRYTFVGGIAFIFDFSTLYLLTEFFQVYYLISAAIAFLLGLTINYVLSIFWVFKTRVIKSKWLEFGIFALIGIIGLGLNELIIWTFTEYVGFHYMASKIVSTLIIYLWNFFTRKYILYNKR
ncbi:MAG: GtrA family protein [Candidatus Cloacimonetes bacterium]|nr:GtrA family protein [Candidatus Cloacimonadota bacterium]